MLNSNLSLYPFPGEKYDWKLHSILKWTQAEKFRRVSGLSTLPWKLLKKAFMQSHKHYVNNNGNNSLLSYIIWAKLQWKMLLFKEKLQLNIQWKYLRVKTE